MSWVDKPARLSFSCSLDLLLNEISDIDQTNINRDFRDGNWLSTSGSSCSLFNPSWCLVVLGKARFKQISYTLIEDTGG